MDSKIMRDGNYDSEIKQKVVAENQVNGALHNFTIWAAK